MCMTILEFLILIFIFTHWSEVYQAAESLLKFLINLT